MSQITPEVKEAIKTAIQLEKDGRKFFEQAAEETKNELGQKMFHKLANDEIRHLVTFEKMFKTLADPNTWRELLKGGQPRERMPYFAEKAENRSPAETGAGEVSALRQALEVERKAIDFFRQVAERAEDPEAKRIFEIIAEEEVTHYDLIQAQIDSVTNSGFWFDVGEFQMDGMY
jgi:rubrerythrin